MKTSGSKSTEPAAYLPVQLGRCVTGYIVRPEPPRAPLEIWEDCVSSNYHTNILQVLQNMPKRKPVTDKFDEATVTCDHGVVWMEDCAGCMLDITACINQLKGEPGSDSFLRAINQARELTALHERQKHWRNQHCV